jgi:hypothetical protein
MATHGLGGWYGLGCAVSGACFQKKKNNVVGTEKTHKPQA